MVTSFVWGATAWKEDTRKVGDIPMFLTRFAVSLKSRLARQRHVGAENGSVSLDKSRRLEGPESEK